MRAMMMNRRTVPRPDMPRPAEIEALGRRIQARRSERGVTLDVMSDRTGFSKGYLSRIENGKKTPPLDTLARIARALGTDVNTLLSERRAEAETAAPFFNVVRAGERRRVLRTESAFGYDYDRLSDGDAPALMQPFVVSLPVDVDRHVFFEHDGQEFIYVLTGRVEWQIGHHHTVLEVGDSLYLDSRIPHRARAVDAPATAIIVLTPRREPRVTSDLAYPAPATPPVPSV